MSFGRISLWLALLASGCTGSQPVSTTPSTRGPGPSQETAARPNPVAQPDSNRPPVAAFPAGPSDPAPRPYGSVITAEAKSRTGLFKTHRIGSRVYFEIPTRELNKEMLLVTRTARVPLEAGYGGQQVGRSYVLRWERREHRVILRSVSYETVADSMKPIYQAVRQSNNDLVVGAFNVEAYGPDSAAVIEVSRFYTAPPPEFGPGNRFRGVPDANRSFVERVLSFPTNVEVEATLTFPPPPPAPGAPVNPFDPGPTGTASVLMHWSMIRLPETPMMSRLADKRIGFFDLEQIDYGRPEQRAQNRNYIVRWRLEKKDPTAAISDPVTPITYYVDPATPDWLKPYVRQGIEDWQPAFETAGFRRGIVAKDAPTKEQDPDWAPEDARYSVVRWFPSTIENATGPNVHDPRTGEIIESDIYMFHNIMTLQRTWYFSQVGHLDARARMWPFPDSLMGRLVRFVVAHEVGHTLGYQHDQKGSATYPVDSVRSKSWVRTMGHSPSIMDYSRFNYTAQPEDGIAIEDLIPRIGPWDKYTTHWGYAPIAGAQTPDDEWHTLDQWSREQDSIPWYRFNMSDSRGADQGDQSEAVGDADAVKATAWGLRSIRQIVPLLVPAAVHQGEDYSDLTLMYDRLVGQWGTELRHVANVVGAAESRERYAGQEGPRYVPFNRVRQKAALRFLNDNAFATPVYLLVDDIVRKIAVEGALTRINGAQAGVLSGLLSDRRLERLIEYEALAANKTEAYSLSEMMTDLRMGLWSELTTSRVVVDPYRRELQRSYLAQVKGKLNPVAPQLPPGLPPQFAAQFAPARPTSDIQAAFRFELASLEREIRGALPRAGNQITRAHLEDALAQIDRALHPMR